MLEVGGRGRVKMALGGGMQDKKEAGGGTLYPCPPPFKGQVRPIETLVLLIVLLFKNTMLFTGT